MSNVPQTPNFKLFKPPFDRKAWHQYVNKNFETIDAVLTTYLDVGNIVGVWENSTSYSDGDRTVDPDVGQVFEAAQNHTSAASPTTFAQERVNNPTYWTSLAVSARGLGAWQPGTLYQPNDFVVDGTIYAVCIATHTSTGVFANDAAFWDYLIDVSSLPTLPSTTGEALNILRVKADETGAEWVDDTAIIAWLGLDSAAFLPASTFATAAHNHPVADLSDASANGKSLISAADYAAMRGLLSLGSVALLNSIAYANIQNVTDARLLGRSAGSDGVVQEITVGTGLSLSGGALTSSTKSSFHATKNGTSQSNIASSDTKVTFGTTEHNTGSNYNTGTSIYTVPRAGPYLVCVGLTFDPTGGANQLVLGSVYKNGAAHKQSGDRIESTSGGQTVIISYIANFAVNDTLEVYASDSGAAANAIIRGPSTETWFSVHEL